jgi:hypothetical protein
MSEQTATTVEGGSSIEPSAFSSTSPAEITPDLKTTEGQQLQLLQERVEELERRLLAQSLDGEGAAVRSTEPIAEPSPNRRSFLRLAGVAATGLAISALGTEKAAAADGAAILQGSAADANNTSGTTTTVTSTGAGLTASGFRGVGAPNTNGVTGRSNGALGAGVWGDSDSGYGVYGTSSAGYDLYGAGNGRIGMRPHLAAGTPTAGSYDIGDIIRNAAGDTYVCTVAGVAPSVAKFQKIAGPAAGGSVHLVPSPTRIFDSRAAQPPFSGPKGIVTNGWEFLFSPPVEAGSKAAIVSLLVFDTLSNGYLTAWENGKPRPGTINAFWTAGMATASTTFVALSPAGQFRLFCANDPGGVNIAIDLLGYLR